MICFYQKNKDFIKYYKEIFILVNSSLFSIAFDGDLTIRTLIYFLQTIRNNEKYFISAVVHWYFFFLALYLYIAELSIILFKSSLINCTIPDVYCF